MGQHLLATVPSIVVGGAFLWILYSLLRGEMGDKTDDQDRREDHSAEHNEDRGDS